MNNCQVFTPTYIVDLMLDMLGYKDDNIKNKTIFEPSFGEGAFLVAIVNRILTYSKKQKLTHKETIGILDNVYGVEIDKQCYDKTIQKLNEMISDYGLNYKWQNLVCCNTFNYIPPIKFNFTVANPPYQKIMHMNLSVRNKIKTNYQFTAGNTDLYIAFFEYCLKIMNSTGKLCFITPNSYFKNSSQASFRKYLSDNNLIDTIIDYSNVKIFGAIATYTAISLLDFNKETQLTQYIMMKNKTEKEYQSTIDLKSFGVNPWVFTNSLDTKFLKEIAERKIKLKDLCDIQHGITTNADKVYVISEDEVNKFESDVVRPIVKASNLDSGNKIIFPYVWDKSINRYVVISEKMMKEKYPKTYEYLSDHRHILDKRNMERCNTEWYQYARSQGIQNSNNKKFALKHVLSSEDTFCKIKELDENTLVYSGIYIIVKDEKNYNKVKQILLSKEFFRYLFLVGKNMAGGYRCVSAKFIKEFGIEI